MTATYVMIPSPNQRPDDRGRNVLVVRAALRAAHDLTEELRRRKNALGLNNASVQH